MNEIEILKKIKSSIDETPINLLDDIKKQPRVKMLKHDNITKQQSFGDVAKKIMPFAVAVALFLVVLTNWQFQTTVPYASIYLDVNPSVRITTNRKEEIIKLEADNKEGEELILDIAFTGKSAEEITQILLDKMVEKNYITTENEYILLSVDHKNEEKAEQESTNLDEIIHEHFENSQISPIVLEQVFKNSSEIEELEKKYSVSKNKTIFIKNIMNLSSMFEEEDLVNLSIAELVELVSANNLDLETIIKTQDMEKIELNSQKKLDESAKEKIDNETKNPQDSAVDSVGNEDDDVE